MQIKSLLHEEGIRFWTEWEKESANNQRQLSRLRFVLVAVNVTCFSALVGLLGILIFQTSGGLGSFEFFGRIFDIVSALFSALTLLFAVGLIGFGWLEDQFKKLLNGMETKLRLIKGKTLISIVLVNVESIRGTVFLAQSSRGHLYVRLVSSSPEELKKALGTFLRSYPVRGLLILTGLREETVQNVNQLTTGVVFAQLAKNTNGEWLGPSFVFWQELRRREDNPTADSKVLDESVYLPK